MKESVPRIHLSRVAHLVGPHFSTDRRRETHQQRQIRTLDHGVTPRDLI